MEILRQTALIFITAGIGAQAGYPIFGWFHLVMIVLVIQYLSWMRHKQLSVSLAELAIIVASGLISIVITNSGLGVAVAFALRLGSLCLITYSAWLLFPRKIKQHWHLYK